MSSWYEILEKRNKEIEAVKKEIKKLGALDSRILTI